MKIKIFPKICSKILLTNKFYDFYDLLKRNRQKFKLLSQAPRRFNMKTNDTEISQSCVWTQKGLRK